MFPRKCHNILLSNGANDALDFLGAHSPACSDNLAADVLSDGGGAVEGEQDGGFELGFCALDFGFGDGVGEARPFAEGEVHEVVDAGYFVGDEVDAP